MKKVNYGSLEWETFAEVNEVEHDVTVFYDTSPAEPDVNWGGDLDITAVMVGDKDVLCEMTHEEREQLIMRLNDHENERTDTYNDDRW